MFEVHLGFIFQVNKQSVYPFETSKKIMQSSTIKYSKYVTMLIFLVKVIKFVAKLILYYFNKFTVKIGDKIKQKK